MRPNRWIVLALLLSGAARAQAQAVPGNFYVVINNTNGAQMCAIKWLGTAWSPWFKIGRAANWQLRRAGNDLYFQYRPPVRQVRYTLHLQKRYSLLRATDGGVELVEVTATGH
jgi:hypothetical protein